LVEQESLDGEDFAKLMAVPKASRSAA